jgi:transposase-like protein
MMDVKQNGARGRGAQRAVGERSAAATRGAARAAVPNPELTERPRRRGFTADYKLRIVREADRCTQAGEIGALLRREGLYTSHLSAWRRQRDRGGLVALGRPRGRRHGHPLAAEVATLRKRAERAEAELAKARKVIEVQGNVSALLGILLESGSAPSAPTNASAGG